MLLHENARPTLLLLLHPAQPHSSPLDRTWNSLLHSEKVECGQMNRRTKGVVEGGCAAVLYGIWLSSSALGSCSLRPATIKGEYWVRYAIRVESVNENYVYIYCSCWRTWNIARWKRNCVAAKKFSERKRENWGWKIHNIFECNAAIIMNTLKSSTELTRRRMAFENCKSFYVN